MIFNNKTKIASSWLAGDIWLPRVEAKAGEKVSIEVELNWNLSGVTKDWSVSAWGEEGGVTVIHDEGYLSDSFPF